MAEGDSWRGSKAEAKKRLAPLTLVVLKYASVDQSFALFFFLGKFLCGR